MALRQADRMVIALYVHDLSHTGVVRNALVVARALAEGGQRVQIVTALPGGDAPPGVEHVALLRRPMRRRWLEHLAVIPVLRRYLRLRRPAIAVSMGNHSHAVFWAAAIGCRNTKRIYRISNDLNRTMAGAPRGGVFKRWLRPRFAQILSQQADALVLVSPSLLDNPVLAAAQAAGKAFVIPNGVDVAEAGRRAAAPSPHPWLDDEQPVIVAIGRLAPQKNFQTLLQAVALVNETRPARLIILGESRDSAQSELMAEAQALGIDEQLLLPGTTDNVFAWLARADLFALPSWWEGSANVLLEAIAVGTAVVASRTAGNAAEIVGSSYGRLVAPNDASEMAEAISLQLDLTTRIEPGDRASDYDLAKTLAAWRDFINGLRAPGKVGIHATHPIAAKASPQISVVMPLYNRAAIIRRACDSVLGQTFSDFELIVVDDGSTDGGAEIVEAIADPRVQLVRLDRNRGANAARNEGIRRARGRIICFLDSDDLFLPHKLQTVSRTYASRPDLDGLIDSFRTTERKKGDKDCRNPDLMGSAAVLEALFSRRIWKSTSGISVTREAALRVGLFDETLKRRQDFDFLVRLLRSGKVATIGTISWLKTYSDDGITRDLGNFMSDFIAFWDRHPQYYADPAFRRGFSADITRHYAKLIAGRRFDLLPRDIGLVRDRIGSVGIAKAMLVGSGELLVLERYRRAA